MHVSGPLLMVMVVFLAVLLIGAAWGALNDLRDFQNESSVIKLDGQQPQEHFEIRFVEASIFSCARRQSMAACLAMRHSTPKCTATQCPRSRSPKLRHSAATGGLNRR